MSLGTHMPLSSASAVRGLFLAVMLASAAAGSSIVRQGGEVKEYSNRPYSMKQDLLHIDVDAPQAADVAGEAAAAAFADIADALRTHLQPPSFKPYARDAKPATGTVFDDATLGGVSNAKSSGGRDLSGLLTSLKAKASSSIADQPRPVYDQGSPSVNEIAKKSTLTLLEKASSKLSFLEEYEVIRRHDRSAADSHKGASCGDDCSLLELNEEAAHWVQLRLQKLQERKVAVGPGVSFLEEEAEWTLKQDMLAFTPPQLLILSVSGGYGSLGAGVDLVYDVATYSWGTFASLSGGVDPIAIALSPESYLKDVFQSFFYKPAISLTATVSIGLGWKGTYLKTCIPEAYAGWCMNADVSLSVVSNVFGLPPPFSVPIMAAVSSDGPTKGALSMDMAGLKSVAVGLRVSSTYSPVAVSVGYGYYWALGQVRHRTLQDFLLNLDPIGDYFSALFGSKNQPSGDHPLNAAHSVMQMAGLPLSVFVGVLSIVNELIGVPVPYENVKCQDTSTSLRSIWTLLGDLFTPERLAAAQHNQLGVRYGLQGPDGQGIFESPGSSGVTPLWFRQDAAHIHWQWSPDRFNWMPVSDKVVHGGKWDGQSPVQRNIDVLIALQAAEAVAAARAEIQQKMASGLQAAQAGPPSPALLNSVVNAQSAALSQLQLHALARRFGMTGPDNSGLYTFSQGCTVYFRYANGWQAKVASTEWQDIATGPIVCVDANDVRFGLKTATAACATVNQAGKAATADDQAHCLGLTGPTDRVYINPRDNFHADFYFRMSDARHWEFSADKKAWYSCADFPQNVKPDDEDLTIIRALAALTS